MHNQAPIANALRDGLHDLLLNLQQRHLIGYFLPKTLQYLNDQDILLHRLPGLTDNFHEKSASRGERVDAEVLAVIVLKLALVLVLVLVLVLAHAENLVIAFLNEGALGHAGVGAAELRYEIRQEARVHDRCGDEAEMIGITSLRGWPGMQ